MLPNERMFGLKPSLLMFFILRNEMLQYSEIFCTGFLFQVVHVSHPNAQNCSCLCSNIILIPSCIQICSLSIAAAKSDCV